MLALLALLYSSLVSLNSPSLQGSGDTLGWTAGDLSKWMTWSLERMDTVLIASQHGVLAFSCLAVSSARSKTNSFSPRNVVLCRTRGLVLSFEDWCCTVALRICLQVDPSWIFNLYIYINEISSFATLHQHQWPQSHVCSLCRRSPVPQGVPRLSSNEACSRSAVIMVILIQWHWWSQWGLV